MRRILVLLTAAAMVLSSAGAALAGPPTDFPGKGKGADKKAEHAADKPVKIDICHLADDGSFHVISIPEAALEAHLAHGDAFGVTFDEENQRGNNGRLDCSSIALFDEAFDLSPDAVFANGGDYENEWVEAAIEAGYTGDVSVSLALDSGQVVFDFTFSNLPIAETFTVYVDTDGGSAGPFTVLGTFDVDAFGEGSFQYVTSEAPGTYTWSFWVNQPVPPASVLQTGDITFTIE